jgi:hypothetical protein
LPSLTFNGYAAPMSTEPTDARLTEQLVVQESKAVRAQLNAYRTQRAESEGLNLSEAAAVRLCIRRALPLLLADLGNQPDELPALPKRHPGQGELFSESEV